MPLPKDTTLAQDLAHIRITITLLLEDLERKWGGKKRKSR
jgi:hypothetical protein